VVSLDTLYFTLAVGFGLTMLAFDYAAGREERAFLRREGEVRTGLQLLPRFEGPERTTARGWRYRKRSLVCLAGSGFFGVLWWLQVT
jgi:hypothetical protein